MDTKTLQHMMTEVKVEIVNQGFKINEGSASPEELLYLATAARKAGARLIGETGFHLGYSSMAFLMADPEAKVVSFDIGKHPYVKAAKEIVDRKFPGRHELIIGDSKLTVPAYWEEHRGIKFDFIFIDGGHDYSTAQADLMNMQRLARKNTPVVIDDLTPWLPWGQGPTRAWVEAVRDGLIIQKELYKDGELVERIEPLGERSWALGYYNL